MRTRTIEDEERDHRIWERRQLARRRAAKAVQDPTVRAEAEGLIHYWADSPSNDFSEELREELEWCLHERERDRDWDDWWEWSQAEERYARQEARSKRQV